jgi:tetratricopeptide (TPR) repeat protein
MQMGRQPVEALDGRLAGQVCLRNNGQAVVEGALAPAGHRYLITLTATGCANGRLLSAQKTLVDRRDDVVPALDGLIDRTRRRLGESPEAIKRFDVALLHGQTASLEALEAYSEGVRAADGGRLADAIALQQHAVDLDPNFAAAHLELARTMFNIGRYKESRLESTKAFELRDTANASLRYSIEIIYHLVADLDYLRTHALARAATAVFPDHLIGWGQQANVDIQLGRYDDAVNEARRELALDTGREGAYNRLAEALRDAGRLAEAQRVCQDAVAHHVAGGLIAGQMAELALARGDRAAFAAVIADGRGHPWEPSLVQLEARAAYAAGQMRRGDDLFERAAGLYAATGEDPDFLGHQALALALAGELDRASRLVASPLLPGAPVNLSRVSMLYALSEAGQLRRATSLLDQFRRDGPQDTTLNTVFAPVASATLDLTQGRARVALADLSPAAPFEARDNAAPYLRGRIYLALKDGAAAAAEFRKVIDRRGVDPEDIRHPLAWLGLARAEAMEGRFADSRRDYLKFVDLWRDADPDVPVLIQARAELQALPGAP